MLDVTVTFATHRSHTKASNNLQKHLNELQQWLDRWRIKANESKSVHVTFTMKRETCTPVLLNGHQLPQSNEAK